MVLCVETNFILEIAFERASSRDCESILELARGGRVQLALPVFSTVESYSALFQAERRRQDLHRALEQEATDLVRSGPYSDIQDLVDPVTRLFVKSNEENRRRLDSALGRLLEVCTLIPFTGEVVALGGRLESELGLSPQDSIVLASVLTHLKGTDTEPRGFATSDRRDFGDRDIRTALREQNCKLLLSFDAAVGFATHGG